MTDFVELTEHLRVHAVRTDGPFTLRSGQTSEWYIDARQTTFDGAGARLVGQAVLSVLDSDIDALGGMTIGADPIAVAAAVAAAEGGRRLRAFSVRKDAKAHGLGGRLVGPVESGDRVAILDDTSTTGGALVEAVDAALDEGLIVGQAICLVDRSDGVLAGRLAERNIPYRALVTPTMLGVA